MSLPFTPNPASTWTQPIDWRVEQAAVLNGETAGPVGGSAKQRVHTVVVNDTELPDDQVQAAVQEWMTDSYFVEHSSLAGAQSTFQTYINDGSLLAKHRYRTPTNVIEEMKLARDLAERDDDVRAIFGGMLALAFEHLEHYAKDDKTVDIFRQIAKPRRMDLLRVAKECYREWLITSTLTTVHLFHRDILQVHQDSDDGEYNANPTMLPVQVLTPRVGILPGENIRVVGSDLFGDQALAYWPGDDPKLSKFLEEFFADKTTAARRNEMRKIDPISTTLFVQPVKVQEQQAFLPGTAFVAYLMNPQMVHRSTMPKGFWPYPRPLLAAAFAMFEAKRLLNIMDFALLQGAANYIVVAKKGTDQRPALPPEITQTRELVRHIGRTGVVVADHRLSFEIITPELNDLLKKEKRNLISIQLTKVLLRKPLNVTDDAAAQGAKMEAEWVSRVITDDRRDILRHIEHIYEATEDANPGVIKECPEIWCPKIILGDDNFFTDYVLKLRDRGDIPRQYAVEAAGFNWRAAVATRGREVEADIDDKMQPAAVPYTVPAGVPDPTVGPEKKPAGAGPQDNNSGRPKGGSNANGRPGSQPSRSTKDPARPTRTIHRNAGETVKAWRDTPNEGEPYRMGNLTRELLHLYADTAEEGRLSAKERKAIVSTGVQESGPLTIVPVNEGVELADLKAVRLTNGATLYVGYRADGAIMARALGFRSPEFDPLAAVETAMKWGFDVNQEDEDDDE